MTEKNRGFIGYVFTHPHLVVVLALLILVMGIYASFAIKTDLFPDVNRPTVAVMVTRPGASAKDMAEYVARPIERACNALSDIRKVSSVSKDEVAVVTAEFRYGRNLQAALTDVLAAVQKVQALLPDGILPPQVFKIGEFTNPVMTLAVLPAPGGPYDLALARQMAENDLKDALLALPEVADAEVFGGIRREVEIRLDPARAGKFGIPFQVVMDAVRAGNMDIPEGFVLNDKAQVILKTRGELTRIRALRDLPIPWKGRVLHLRDLADVKNGEADRFSAFRFNGKPAVAVNILRHEDTNTVATIRAVEKALPGLKERFPNLEIHVADTQKRVIDLSVSNLKDSLRDAIIFTVLVIFLMLADLRAALITGISIPFTFFLTFTVMMLTGMQFNMVTLTAVILAVGMLVDDAIVVVENIDRKYKAEGGDLRETAMSATREIMLADFSGTFSTVLVLVPIMFVGGYVQRVLRPLTTTLSIALGASFIVSVTLIPLLAPWIIKRTEKKEYLVIRLLDGLARLFQIPMVGGLQRFFTSTFDFVHRFKWIFLPLLVVLLPLSLKQMDLVGRDLMPPMDTGIMKIRVETESDSSLERTEALMKRIEARIRKEKGLLSMLGFAGSEPGLITFGKGRTPQQIDFTVNLVDRFHRKKTIWEIEDGLRDSIRAMPGVKNADVYEFGSTPLSSIASTVDVEIAGNDFEDLDRAGGKVARELIRRPGFTSVSRSWKMDRPEYHLVFDKDKCARFGLNVEQVSAQIATAVKGVPLSVFRVFNQDGVRIRFRYGPERRDDIEKVLAAQILTPTGNYVPLAELARAEKVLVPTVITRNKLAYTTNVHGYRATAPVTFLNKQRDIAVKKAGLPPRLKVSEEGEMSQMKESFGRLGSALVLSILLLYLTFVVIFRSFSDPVVIMLAIPFAAIGAVWALLVAGKHGCMPAFMGFILLVGVVVNNSILLIDFIKTYRKEGHPLFEAVKMAVKVRTRPILMTAVTTIVGMIPVAMEWAVGLERLSPLAIVAIGGLLVGTFLTLVFIPTLYLIKEWLLGLFRRKGTSA